MMAAQDGQVCVDPKDIMGYLANLDLQDLPVRTIISTLVQREITERTDCQAFQDYLDQRATLVYQGLMGLLDPKAILDSLPWDPRARQAILVLMVPQDATDSMEHLEHLAYRAPRDSKASLVIKATLDLPFLDPLDPRDQGDMMAFQARKDRKETGAKMDLLGTQV